MTMKKRYRYSTIRRRRRRRPLFVIKRMNDIGWRNPTAEIKNAANAPYFEVLKYTTATSTRVVVNFDPFPSIRIDSIRWILSLIHTVKIPAFKYTVSI
jgi:hypothetical protein